MGFLKRLFGGGDNGEDKDGLYFYIKSKRSDEVIPVRLHRYNDLSASDDFQSYYAHKVVVGERSFDRIAVDFNFDKNRRLVSADIEGGDLVDREDYDAYLARREAQSGNADDANTPA